jgi:hypothetical protein
MDTLLDNSNRLHSVIVFGRFFPKKHNCWNKRTSSGEMANWEKFDGGEAVV